MISIVITTLNRLQTLKACLSAIRYSDGFDKLVREIIVVDDGSSDQTEAYLLQSKANGTITEYVRNNSSRGPATARNQGVEIAKAPYTLIMGDDVILMKQTLSMFKDHVEKHDMSSSSVIGNIIPYPFGMTPFEYWSSHGGSQFGHSTVQCENSLDVGEKLFGTSNILIPTEILRCFPFDQTFPYARYEDRELGYRLKKETGHTVHYIPQAISWHLHRLDFKEWLPKWDHFTWAALHFSALYKEDHLLSQQLMIDHAKEMSSFCAEDLMGSVDIVNQSSKLHISNPLCEPFHEKLFSEYRNIQEFFRMAYYRKHLSLCPIYAIDRSLDSSQMMDMILQSIV